MFLENQEFFGGNLSTNLVSIRSFEDCSSCSSTNTYIFSISEIKMAGSKKSTPEYRRSRLAARAAQRGTYIDIPPVLDSISELLQEVGEYFPNNTSLNSQSYASKMLDQEEVDKYNRLYAIPPPFKLTLVGPGDRTCNWRPSDLCIYKEVLMSGVRIPFHDFIIRLLANLRINPCQLVPNAWRVITCFIALCTNKQLPLSVPVFRSIFQFRNSPFELSGLGVCSTSSRGSKYLSMPTLSLRTIRDGGISLCSFIGKVVIGELCSSPPLLG